jgi:hypothetical protein
VSIEQCNADGTTPASAVQAGSNAYFKITVGTDSTPLEGTVAVYYNTENGPSIDGSQVAVANTDYIASGDQSLTFTYASGYAPQIIPVPTVVTSNGGTFSVEVPCLFDPFAATPCTAESAPATIAAPSLQLMLTQPGQEDKNVNNNSANQDSVPIGELIKLTVTGAPANATFNWKLPAYPTDAVGGFNTGTPGGPFSAELPPVPDGYVDDHRSIAWVHGDPDQKIRVIVTIPGLAPQTLTGYFNVKAPTNPVVQLTPYNGGPDFGVTAPPFAASGHPLGAVRVGFGWTNEPGVFPDDPKTGQAGVTFTANLNETDKTIWDYGWGQILDYFSLTIIGPGETKYIPPQGGVLDSSFPIREPNATAGDLPAVTLDPGQSLTYEIFATIWLMVESKHDPVWVSEARTNWYWTVFVTFKGPKPVIVYTSHEPTVLTNFTPTNFFPMWTKGANANLITIVTP